MDGALFDVLPDYDELIPNVIDELISKRWAVVPGFFSPALTGALYQELLDHRREGELHPAKIGKDIDETLRRDIRGDDILWLDGATEDQRYFLDILERFRFSLNRELFLGLEELETHFAVYPPGAGYQKHLDSFQNNNYRRITVVTYLNPHWQPEDGGELLLFSSEDELIATVPPVAGTLVCFVSEEFPHEVAVTQSMRYSIAGWYRTREPI